MLRIISNFKFNSKFSDQCSRVSFYAYSWSRFNENVEKVVHHSLQFSILNITYFCK